MLHHLLVNVPISKDLLINGLILYIDFNFEYKINLS